MEHSSSQSLDTNMQELLEDERARCQRHKENYTLLKMENQKLQEEILTLQREMKLILKECNEAKEMSEKSVEMTCQTLNHKQMEVENLRKIIEMNDPIVLRHAIKKELEVTIENQMKELEQELETAQSEHQQMQFGNALLKTQIDSLELFHHRGLKEMKVKHELDLRNLKESKDLLMKELTKANAASDSNRLKTLMKENNSLKALVSSLNIELKEIREIKNDGKIEAQNACQLLTKQATQHGKVIRNFQTEKLSLSMQKDSLFKELENMKEENVKVSAQVNDLKQESQRLRDQLQKNLHQYELELSEAKIINAQLKAESNKEIEKALAKLSCSTLSLEILEENYKKLQLATEERENSYKKTVQMLSNHKKDSQEIIFKLETNLKEIETEKTVLSKDLRTKIAKLESATKDLEENKAKLEKQSATLKSTMQKELEMERRLCEFKFEGELITEKLTKEQRKLKEAQKIEQELRDQREHLKEVAAKMVDELEKNKEQLVRERSAIETILSENKLQWEVERTQLIAKIEKAEKQLVKEDISRDDEMINYKKKISGLNKNILKLRTKIGELRDERKELEKNVPSKIHESLQQQFLEFQRKHQQFKTILLSSPLDGIHS